MLFIPLRRSSSLRVTGRLGRDRARKLREQVLRALAGVLGHEGINDNERRHRFDDGDGTGSNAGVVATLGLEGALLQTVGSSSLSLADGGSGLESNAEVDIGSVGDTTLDTTGVVGLGGQLGGAG